MSGLDIRLEFLHCRPKKVHCSTKDAYTSEITFLAVDDVIFSDPLFKVRHTQRPINNQQGVDLTLCLTENALLFIVVYKEAIT